MDLLHKLVRTGQEMKYGSGPVTLIVSNSWITTFFAVIFIEQIGCGCDGNSASLCKSLTRCRWSHAMDGGLALKLFGGLFRNMIDGAKCPEAMQLVV